MNTGSGLKQGWGNERVGGWYFVIHEMKSFTILHTNIYQTNEFCMNVFLYKTESYWKRIQDLLHCLCKEIKRIIYFCCLVFLWLILIQLNGCNQCRLHLHTPLLWQKVLVCKHFCLKYRFSPNLITWPPNSKVEYQPLVSAAHSATA